MVAAKPARYFNVWRSSKFFSVSSPLAERVDGSGGPCSLGGPRGESGGNGEVDARHRSRCGPGADLSADCGTSAGARGEAGPRADTARGVHGDVAGTGRTTLRGGRVLHPRDPDEGPCIGCGGPRPEARGSPPPRGRARNRGVPPSPDPVSQPQGGVRRGREGAVPARRAVGPQGDARIVPLAGGRAGLARAGGRRLLDEGGVPPPEEHRVLGPPRDPRPARPPEPRPPRRDPLRPEVPHVEAVPGDRGPLAGVRGRRGNSARGARPRVLQPGGRSDFEVGPRFRGRWTRPSPSASCPGTGSTAATSRSAAPGTRTRSSSPRSSSRGPASPPVSRTTSGSSPASRPWATSPGPPGKKS